MSIGATANGVGVEEDATGLSKWNYGLKDRYNIKIVEPDLPKEVDEFKAAEVVKYIGGGRVASYLKKFTIPKEAKIYPIELRIDYNFNDGTETTESSINPGGGVTYSTFPTSVRKELVFKGEMDVQLGMITKTLTADISSYIRGTAIPTNDSISHGYGVAGMSLVSLETLIVDSANKEKSTRPLYEAMLNTMSKAYGISIPVPQYNDSAFSADTIEEATDDDLDTIAKETLKKQQALAGLNYQAYLVQMFGGTIQLTEEQKTQLSSQTGIEIDDIDYAQSSYTHITGQDSFSDSGKSSYKIYYKEKFSSKYNPKDPNSTPTNQLGLIPIEFDLELDGISGFQIYNKILINQEFLPSYYAQALEFLIKGISHKVDSNGWTTNLQTLSTSNLNSIPISRKRGPQKRVVPKKNYSRKTSYPELELIPKPDATYLPFSEAKQILNEITDQNTAKAVFAILLAEARAIPENSSPKTKFRSPGGFNYSGTQTDSGKWGGQNYFKSRYLTEDNGKEVREFAVFESNRTFLEFMRDAITRKGIDGENGDKWTSLYINNWWSPPSKSTLSKGTKIYNEKLAIYNTAIKKYNQV